MLLHLLYLPQVPVDMAKDVDIHLMNIVLAWIAIVGTQIFICHFDIINGLISHFLKPGHVVFQLVESHWHRVREWLCEIARNVRSFFHDKSTVITIRFSACVELRLWFAINAFANLPAINQFINSEMLHHLVDGPPLIWFFEVVYKENALHLIRCRAFPNDFYRQLSTL